MTSEKRRSHSWLCELVRIETKTVTRALIFAGIEDGDAALDDALFLELLDAPPARRRRQPHLLRDVGDGKRRVFLQQAQDFAVEAIHQQAPDEKIRLFSQQHSTAVTRKKFSAIALLTGLGLLATGAQADGGFPFSGKAANPFQTTDCASASRYCARTDAAAAARAVAPAPRRSRASSSPSRSAKPPRVSPICQACA